MWKSKHTQTDTIKKKIKEEFWDTYNSQTSILSDNFRRLAFAEGSICLFYPSNSQQTLDLKYILILLVIFFICDALQYLIAVIIYYFVAQCYEHHLNHLENPAEVKRYGWMNITSGVLFFLKIIPLVLATDEILRKILAVS